MAISNLSLSEQKGLLIVAQTCATFSVVGSLFIVVCWYRYRHLRKLSFTLVLWLAVSDIGADITYFMGNPEGATCTAQGSLQQFFQLAQILWTVAIASVLHEVTVNLRMYHQHDQKHIMRRFHAYVWGAALVGMLLPFTSNSYGSTGAWCWIAIDVHGDVDVGTMWRYLVLYIPVWSAIIYNITVYVRIVGVVRRFSVGVGGSGVGGESVGPSEEQQVRMTKFMNRLMWYPAVLIVAWTFATINRIQNAVHPDDPVFGLFLLHKMMVALQGLMNACVYGSTDAVRDAVSKDRWLGACQRGSGASDGPDPEDDVNPTGVSMTSASFNAAIDDSLGGFGESGKFGAPGSTLPTSGEAGATGENDTADIDNVEVYNKAHYTVTL